MVTFKFMHAFLNKSHCVLNGNRVLHIEKKMSMSASLIMFTLSIIMLTLSALRGSGELLNTPVVPLGVGCRTFGFL